MPTRSLRLLVLLGLLAGCAGQPPAPVKPPACAPCPVCQACPPQLPPTPPVQPPARPLQAARWEDVQGWPGEDPGAAWPPFLESCKHLQKQAIWKDTCAAALALPAEEARDPARLKAFFEARLKPWQVANPDDSKEGLVTGYYEPLLKGARHRGGAARHPLYAPPDDMLTLDFGDLYPELKNLRLRGRVEGKKVLPYWSRAELTERQGQMKDKVLVWVNDPIEAFFLEIQGSGRVQLPDGSLMRLGYADQNGQPYHSIGRWLINQNELKPEQASMEGIKAWAKAHPERLEELLGANPSYVFFRILTRSDGGPLGALGLPLTPGRSLAVDPRTTPLGAPVFLATTWPNDSKPLERLMLAQDTGGAIRGAVRADFFWGFGPEAGALAGRMKQKGRMWLLMPADYAPK
ncbi:MAG: murein transglycosylase A [Rhodocyclaceae bacterium]|nr:murein transglycosylase A [Rhodocyclaceae bacterium]